MGVTGGGKAGIPNGLTGGAVAAYAFTSAKLSLFGAARDADTDGSTLEWLVEQLQVIQKAILRDRSIFMGPKFEYGHTIVTALTDGSTDPHFLPFLMLAVSRSDAEMQYRSLAMLAGQPAYITPSLRAARAVWQAAITTSTSSSSSSAAAAIAASKVTAELLTTLSRNERDTLAWHCVPMEDTWVCWWHLVQAATRSDQSPTTPGAATSSSSKMTASTVDPDDCLLSHPATLTSRRQCFFGVSFARNPKGELTQSGRTRVCCPHILDLLKPTLSLPSSLSSSAAAAAPAVGVPPVARWMFKALVDSSLPELPIDPTLTGPEAAHAHQCAKDALYQQLMQLLDAAYARAP